MRKKIIALLVAVIFAGSSLVGSVAIAGDKMTCEENLQMLKHELRNLPTIEDLDKAIENGDEFIVDASPECIALCTGLMLGVYAMCVGSGGNPALCWGLAIAFYVTCLANCE